MGETTSDLEDLEDRAPGGEDDEPITTEGDEGAPDGSERDRRRGLRSAVEWVGIIGGALLVALVIKTFLLQAFYIPSASMVPTLEVNDRVLVNKLSYDIHNVNRGDVVVFRAPEGEGDAKVKDLIKRVIAMPGETVEAHDGHLFINGRLLREPYLRPSVVTTTLTPHMIPPGHYWVMGDNRGNSKDSRYFGPISRSLIVGRAFVRVWPLSDVSLL